MGLAGSGHLISDFLVEKKRTEKSRHIWNKVLVPWTFFYHRLCRGGVYLNPPLLVVLPTSIDEQFTSFGRKF